MSDLSERLERVEAQLAIQQLPAKYAVAVDSRNLDELVDADHATGTVYCRAGHEDQGHWVEMAICYFDRYVRSEGRWCFERRDEKHWYSTDWQERPHGPDFQNWPGKYDGPKFAPQLPHAWPSWVRYWTSVGEEARREVTIAP